MGSFISGRLIWAITDPSTNSTMEWIMDWGCISTLMRSAAIPKSQCASMTSRPLFIRVAESMVIFLPMSQVGCDRASPTVICCKFCLFKNGPPEAVRINLFTSSFLPPRRHCFMAECSLSMGKTSAPVSFAFSISSSPAITSDSLLAMARVFPAATASRLGRSPIEPTRAFITR